METRIVSVYCPCEDCRERMRRWFLMAAVAAWN